MEWKPHITVATVVEDHGRFLMVEELKHERAVLNQPAGHLDPNESLIQAAIRETFEETGYDVELTGVIGIYLYTAPAMVRRISACALQAKCSSITPTHRSIPGLSARGG